MKSSGSTTSAARAAGSPAARPATSASPTASRLGRPPRSGAAPTDWSRIGLAEIGALAIYGFGSLAISQLLWLVGVERLGLGVASMHINAAPFYVMIFAVMAGGPWNWAQATGAAIVILGVLIAQGRFRA